MVAIPDDVLNDVFSRFILPEAKCTNNDTIRLCFAIEMAHWFYLDYVRPAMPQLPDCTAVESFAKACFKHMPSLLKPYQEANLVLKQWREFKRRVPVYGAMLITPDSKQVLLVEGNSTRGCWTFPRGKIEEDEDPFDCAIREVCEETSFDISSLADRNFYIEKNCNDRRVRLYIVNNVPESYVFYTKVRGEIANIRWFMIDELPGSPGFKKKKEQFFVVNQFIREYLKGYRTGKKRNNASECDANKSRNRGSSFNEGDSAVSYNGRRGDSHTEAHHTPHRGDHVLSRHEEHHHHQRRDHHQRSRDSQGDSKPRSRDSQGDSKPRSRDSQGDSKPRSREQLDERREPDHLPHRGLYSSDLSTPARHSPNRTSLPHTTDNTRNTRNVSSMRGGRSRRGGGHSSRFPHPPDMTLATFHLDLKKLNEFLPDVPVCRA